MAEKKTVQLGTPVTIGDDEISALKVTVPFRTGFLRGAPPTPGWFIATVRELFDKLPKDKKALEELPDDLSFLTTLGIDVWPKPEDIDQLVPWLMHIAEKATGKPAEVIDQLDLADLLKIIFTQLGGMVQLANFRMTSGNGGETSPGSLDGRPTQ